MNNIPDDVLEEIILNKVKLFTIEEYYRYFRSILLELYKNIGAFKKKESLDKSITLKLKEKNNNKSLWYIITILIFPFHAQLSEESYYEPYSNLNPLCFQYLKNLCYSKIKKLTNLSVVEQVPMDRVLPVYIELCEKKMISNKERKRGILFKKSGNFIQINKDKRSSLLIPRPNSILPRPKLNLKKISGKNGPSIQPLEYSNSFTRLFIGETDEASIKERYLSNLIVKRQKQLHLLNSYGEISYMYLKKMYKKLFKNEEKKGAIDYDMINLMNQFENDHKKIDNFHRSALSSEKIHHYRYDSNQNSFLNALNRQKYNSERHSNNRSINLKRKKFKYNTNSYSIKNYSEMSKNNCENSIKLLNSRKSTQIHAIKYNLLDFIKNRRKNDHLLSNRRSINSCENYKYDTKYNSAKTFRKSTNKNFSSIIGKNEMKNFSSNIMNQKKRSCLVNYMNKKDFFYS